VAVAGISILHHKRLDLAGEDIDCFRKRVAVVGGAGGMMQELASAPMDRPAALLNPPNTTRTSSNACCA